MKVFDPEVTLTMSQLKAITGMGLELAYEIERETYQATNDELYISRILVAIDRKDQQGINFWLKQLEIHRMCEE